MTTIIQAMIEIDMFKYLGGDINPSENIEDETMELIAQMMRDTEAPPDLCELHDLNAMELTMLSRSGVFDLGIELGNIHPEQIRRTISKKDAIFILVNNQNRAGELLTKKMVLEMRCRVRGIINRENFGWNWTMKNMRKYLADPTLF